MGINFPNSPLVGDLWPNPAVAGQGQYTWDGEKWASGSVPASRASIYAAPFDAMAYSGMQINGSMEVSQEVAIGTGTAVNLAHICDGWKFVCNVTGITAYSRTPLFPGIAGAIYYTVGTAKPSLAAGDVFTFQQRIEGYRIARLAWGTASAQPITIAFWAQNSPGTYSVSVRNFDGSRSYVATYTQNAFASEYKTITISGCTDGVWKSDNLIGILLDFTFAAGSTAIAPAANTWYAASYNAAPGQINGIATTSLLANISGVVVLPGIEAPSAARSPLIMRPYDQELLTCKRYWEKITAYTVSYSKAGTALVGIAFPFSVQKRGTPTINYVAGGTYTNCSLNSNAVTTYNFTQILNIATTDTYVMNQDILLDARL